MIKTIFVVLKNIRISLEQAEALRLDFNQKTNNRYDLLHNHQTDGKSIYRYPLVQFRSYKGYAALYGINDGAELIWNLLGSDELPASYTQNIEIVQRESASPLVSETWKTYSIKNMVPFNAVNYQAYKAQGGLVQRSQLIEDKIAANIVGAMVNLKIPFEKDSIMVRLKALKKQPVADLKNEKMLTFDLIFETNLSLPDYMALGRFKSIGFGTIKRMEPNKK